MINLYLQKYTVDQMVEQAGDVIIRRPIKAKCVEERNKVWYLDIEFPEADLLGYKMIDEAFVKVDLPHAKNQLFSVVYHKYNKIKKTYKINAVDIFHMSQREVLVTESKLKNVSTWEEALTTLNKLIEDSKTKFDYILKGSQGYDNTLRPDRFHSYLMVPKWDTTKAIDVYNQSMEPSAYLVAHPMNRTLAQRLYITPDENGIWYQIWNEKSILCFDVLSGATEGSRVTQAGDHSGVNQRWKIIPSPFVEGFWCIVSKLDDNYCLTVDTVNSPVANFRGIILSTKADTAGDKANRQAFQFVRSEAVCLAEWEQMNLIEILFGTNDNAICNKWQECEQSHVTAMYNNLVCYFGGAYSEDWCKPTEYWIVSPKLVTNNERTSDMEKVYTGIIPIGANDRMLPKNYPGTVNGVVILGNNDVVPDLFEMYRFHRIMYADYNEIVWTEDQADANLGELDVYDTEAYLNRALFNRAKKDLRKAENRLPSVNLDMKIAYILDDEHMTSNLKLCDTIYFAGNVSDEPEGFYFDKIEYDLITNRVTNVTLSQIKEDI